MKGRVKSKKVKKWKCVSMPFCLSAFLPFNTSTLLHFVLYTILLFHLFTHSSSAQTEPIARVSISPESVSVGESLNMEVTILVPTWFKGAPEFPSFELPNAITRLPPDSSYPSNELIDGQTWFSIIRNYRILPLTGGRFVLSDQSIRVSYADPETRQAIDVSVPLPSIQFSAIVPAGAESLDPYIAGTRFEITRELKGETDNLESGDALVATYTATLEGLPAIFIPQLANIQELPGISIYSKEPTIEENGRTGSRIEKVTYVFESGGEFPIPGLTLAWWDFNDESIKNETIETISVTVKGPVSTPEKDPSIPSKTWISYLLAAAVILVFFGILYKAAPRIQSAMKKRRESFLASEECAFKRACAALRNHEAKTSIREISVFANRIQKGLLPTDFAHRYGHPDFLSELEAIYSYAYSNNRTDVDFTKLESGLRDARQAALRDASKVYNRDLPLLNP